MRASGSRFGAFYLALLFSVACSDDPAQRATTLDDTQTPDGGQVVNPAADGNAQPADGDLTSGDADGGDDNPGPIGGGACCTDGDCVCRDDDPSQAGEDGPYQVESYADGFRQGDKFGGATIYYPVDAEPPFSGVVLCPGFTARQDSIAGWGPFLASHGIVLMTIDTVTTGDSVDQRDDALLDALLALQQENDRQNSPLFGKMSSERYGLGGWSMGGGGTWLATAAHPELKTAMTLAGHHTTAGGAGVAEGSTVPTIMFAGATDPGFLGGSGQSQAAYDIIPATTPKILYEMAAEGHFSWGTPSTNSGALGRYGLAFQKVFLEGDERYLDILHMEGPGASDWRSNLPEVGY